MSLVTSAAGPSARVISPVTALRSVRESAVATALATSWSWWVRRCSVASGTMTVSLPLSVSLSKIACTVKTAP
jgi:hypothetical protein